jgi:hypothetical protein
LIYFGPVVARSYLSVRPLWPFAVLSPALDFTVDGHEVA